MSVSVCVPTCSLSYQMVISTLSDVLLKKLDDDCSVPLYGFGDVKTANKRVFMLNNEQLCQSKEELLCAYADAAASVTLSGPTSFAPIIYEAIDTCRSTGKYHILVIIADGLMVCAFATQHREAASTHQLARRAAVLHLTVLVNDMRRLLCACASGGPAA